MGTIVISKEAIEKALKDKGLEIECSICRGHEMLIDGQLAAMVPTDGNGGLTIEVGKRNMQTIRIVCSNCGHIEYFDADYLLVD